MKTMRGVVALLGAAGVLSWVACAPQVTCGDGTTKDGLRCVAAVPVPVVCASGTHLDGQQCVRDEGPCAAGTHLELGQCIIDATACGAGTELKNGQCVVPAAPEPPPSRWGANVRVNPAAENAYNGSLEVAAGGHVYVAYNAYSSQDVSVVITVSTDDGLTFVEKKRLTVASNYATYPSIAADAAGHVAVAYLEYEPDPGGTTNGSGPVWVVSSSDFGQTWSAPVAVTTPGASSLNYKPKLSFDGQTLWATWVRYDASDSETLVARSDTFGASFGAPVTLPGSGAGAYGVYRFAQGVVGYGQALWLPYQTVGYDQLTGGYVSAAGLMKATLDQTGTMATVSELNLKKVQYDASRQTETGTAFSVNAAGQRCLTFIDFVARDANIFAATSATDFTAQTKPQLLKLGPGQHGGASSAVDATGVCHLTWLDNRSGEWAVWSGELSIDGTLSATERVSDASFTETDKLVVDATQLKLTATHRYALWQDTRDADQGFYFAKAPLTGQ